jgi:flagellar basal body P-ring formation protein FlgA
LAAQFDAPRNAALTTVHSVNKGFFLRFFLVCTALLAGATHARAQAIEAALATQVEQFALAASLGATQPGLRVQVRVGQLDARLKLAPCTAVQPYLPSGTRLWGASRIGLRCTDGSARWNVFLPIAVDVFGPALVANAPLPAGHVLVADDLRTAEINLSATPSLPLLKSQLAVGRTLARPLAAAAALHANDLRARQWFAAGDSIRLIAAGNGWRIHGEGEALAAGLEGQSVRVRTASGRVVSGVAVAERLVEVAL